MKKYNKYSTNIALVNILLANKIQHHTKNVIIMIK